MDIRDAIASAEELRALLAGQSPPACAELTPFTIVDLSPASGLVVFRFDAQPAFRNHFGHVQGGFGVAMLDVCMSVAAFARFQRWLPTIEIKCSFVAPLPVAACIGEGRVLRAGKAVVFLEGSLRGPDDQILLHATATALVSSP